MVNEVQPIEITHDIVLVGAFNAAILSPPALQRHGVLDGGEIKKSDIEFKGGFNLAAIRLAAGGVNLVIRPERIEIASDCVSDSVSRVKRLIEWLPETPIHELGINYHFSVPAGAGAGAKFFSDENAHAGLGLTDLSTQFRSFSGPVSIDKWECTCTVRRIEESLFFDINYRTRFDNQRMEKIFDELTRTEKLAASVVEAMSE